MNIIYTFHLLNGISEINQLFDDILIIWPASVHSNGQLSRNNWPQNVGKPHSKTLNILLASNQLTSLSNGVRIYSQQPHSSFSSPPGWTIEIHSLSGSLAKVSRNCNISRTVPGSWWGWSWLKPTWSSELHFATKSRTNWYHGSSIATSIMLANLARKLTKASSLLFQENNLGFGDRGK